MPEPFAAPLKFYYMRDNHTFAPLNTHDVEEFVSDIKRQFDDGYTAGMVCGSLGGRHIKDVVHSHGKAEWDKLEAESRRWFVCQTSQALFDPILMGA